MTTTREQRLAAAFEKLRFGLLSQVALKERLNPVGGKS